MLKYSETTLAVRRTHRTYSPEFKAELVAACLVPGASVAALALQQGMNANVLHRWLKEYDQGRHRLPSDAPLIAATAAQAQAQASPAFVPLMLEGSRPARSDAPSDIHIECPRLGLSVHWPVSGAAECARMLRELLR